MKHSGLYRDFIEALEDKIPKKTELADFIAETLFIEKESAYRRLRGEVKFSLQEAFSIAMKLDISLDKVMVKVSPHADGRREAIELSKYFDVKYDVDISTEKALMFMEEMTSAAYSEYGAALRQIPFLLFYNYPLLSRFYICKYLYHKNSPLSNTLYENVQESPLLTQLRREFYQLFRKITYTYLIWQPNIISSLVNDISYFRSIKIIKESEVEELKDELHILLDDLEQLTAEGEYRETGNKFDLYVSNIDIDLGYSYMETEKRQVGLFTAFVYFAISSEEETACANIKDWVKSMKQSSILISGSSIRERILFFEKQHEAVDTLTLS